MDVVSRARDGRALRQTPSTGVHDSSSKYIILLTSAITDYARALEKLSAKGQYFVGARMAVSL